MSFTPAAAGQIDALTSIRFFAAMAVVGFHSGSTWIGGFDEVPQPIKNLMSNGYLGVTFFFVLSGFILQLVYTGRTYSLRGYAVARFARIYPVYLLALALLIPFYGEWGWSSIPQFLLLQCWPGGEAMGFANWNMPAWTLSLELAFYIAFPLFSALVQRIGDVKVAGAVLMIAAFIAITGSSSGTGGALAPVGLPLARFPEFLYGLLLGELYLRTRGLRFYLFPAGIATMLLFCLANTTAVPIATVATLLSGLLFVAVAREPRSITSRFLSWRPMVILGAASYALYLLQIPVRASLNEILPHGKVAALFQYPVLIAVSIVVYILYEEPARAWIKGLERASARSTRSAFRGSLPH